MSNFEDNPWQAPGESRPEAERRTEQAHIPSDLGQEAEPQWRPAEPAPPTETKSGLGRMLAMLLVATLFGGIAGGAVASAVDDEDEPTRATAPASTRGVAAEATPSNIRQVLNQVQPAVVTIQVRGLRGAAGSGTGMIISSDGEVLTNAHVVAGASEIAVTLDGEQEPRSATVVGTDETIDSALLKIKDASGLPTVKFGDSNAIQVGDEVVAIGNALALPGGPSVTSGIISATDRSITDPSANLDDLIQTDAAINPGNSGGPLANMSGEVIGMNTAVIRGSGGEFQNIGFAMAIDSIIPVVEDLRSGQTTTPAFLGVSTVTLDGGIKERYDLTPDAGAVVDSVQPNSPADAAGLSRFDVIVEFDGRPVEANDELVRLVRAKRPGDEVALVYFRDDERRSTQVTLAARPPAR